MVRGPPPATGPLGLVGAAFQHLPRRAKYHHRWLSGDYYRSERNRGNGTGTLAGLHDAIGLEHMRARLLALSGHHAGPDLSSPPCQQCEKTKGCGLGDGFCSMFLLNVASLLYGGPWLGSKNRATWGVNRCAIERSLAS